MLKGTVPRAKMLKFPVSEYEFPKQKSALYFGDGTELEKGKDETKRRNRASAISIWLERILKEEKNFLVNFNRTSWHLFFLYSLPFIFLRGGSI